MDVLKVVSKTKKILIVSMVLITASCSNDNANESEGSVSLTRGSDTTQTKKIDNSFGVSGVSEGISNNREETSKEANKLARESVTEDIASATENEADNDSDSEGFELSEEASYDDGYNEPVYKITLSHEETSGYIQWQAPDGMYYSGAKVMVSAPNGDTVTREFVAGEPLELHGNLPDGVYGWTTVISPEVSPEVRQEMRAVRASGDRQAELELIARLRAEGNLPSEQQSRANVQSGSFIVLDGVVKPNEGVNSDQSDSDGESS